MTQHIPRTLTCALATALMAVGVATVSAGPSVAASGNGSQVDPW